MILGLLACTKEPVVHTIPADDGAVVLRLQNPTTCDTCDPFAAIDTVILEVEQAGDVLSSATFVWPGSELTLPPLDGFGVIRVTLRGLHTGEVQSYGQTPEFVAEPGITVEQNLVFLPVNTALPLTSPLPLPRAHHEAISLRNGRVLLVGGQNPTGERTFPTIDAYDPTLGAFADSGLSLPQGASDLLAAEFPSGERLFVGGTGIFDGVRSPSIGATRYEEESATVAAIEALPFGRTGACMSAYQEGRAIVLGGHAETTPRGSLLRYNTDSAAWTVQDIYFRDLDDRLVTGCTPLLDGRTFVQGSTVGSTGIWDFTEATEGILEPEEAFQFTPESDPGPGAAFVTGATIVSLPSGDAWVGGGIDGSGAMEDRARVLQAGDQRFAIADAQPTVARVRGSLRTVSGGLVAWGCGWRDLLGAQPIQNLELFDIESGAPGPVVPFAEARDGCSLATLPDGSVLITGGAASPSAEIVVPYLE